MKDNAQLQGVDGLVLGSGGNNTSYGSVAQRLMSNGFSVNALRTNDVLRKEEWLLFDRVVVEVARPLLMGISDLVASNLSVPIPDALGTTVVQWETASDMTPAEMDMSGTAGGQRDRQSFNLQQVPLPVIHKDFQLSLRNLHSGRRIGTPLDTSMASVATRRVADLLEATLFNGASLATAGSAAGAAATIYGYTTFTSRNTGTVTGSWVTAAGTTIVGDVLSMIAQLQAVNMFGPYRLYVSVAAYTNMLNDFKTYASESTLERILAIPGMLSVKGTSQLTTSTAVLVQMTSDVVDVLDGIQPMTVMWETMGGLMVHFKVMAIMAPRLKADADGRCGIAHWQ